MKSISIEDTLAVSAKQISKEIIMNTKKFLLATLLLVTALILGACGDKETTAENSPFVGTWNCTVLVEDGNEIKLSDVDQPLPEGRDNYIFLELNSDGTGVLDILGETPTALEWTENEGVIDLTVAGTEEDAVKGSIEDEILLLDNQKGQQLYFEKE